MALVVCEEQVGAWAVRVKGEGTEAPLPGLLTVTPPEAAAAVTVMATSVTQTAPWLPQALTWRVCAPVAAGTWASMEEPLTMVVSVLLSSE